MPASANAPQGATCRVLAMTLCVLLLAPRAHAQDIEPRAYSNAPVGVNFLVGGYVFTRGSLPTDADIPLTDAHLTTSSAVLGYGRVIGLFGQSARINLAIPYTWLGGNALYRGSRGTPSGPGPGHHRGSRRCGWRNR
jgi:hypothetical protein